ncbi:MAG: TolC family protein [Campylobacterales bacterium]
MRIIALWSLLAALVWAATLAELIDAAQGGDLARAGEWRVRAAEAAHAATGRSYLPSVDVGVRFSEVNEVSMEPQLAASATVSWVLFDGFAREHELSARRSEWEASRLEQTDTLNRNALETIRLYFRLIAAVRAVEAQEVQVRRLEAEGERLGGFAGAGIVSSQEVAQIEAALETARYELSALQNDRLGLQLELENLTGLNLEGFSPAPAAVSAPAKALDAQARPDIEAVRHRVRAQGSRAEAVRSAYIPNLTLENVFSKNSYADNNLLDLPEDQNRISLTLSVRLTDFGRLGREREAARAYKRAEESRLQYTQKAAASQQRLAAFRVESAQKRVESARRALASSEIVFAQSEKKFAARLIDEVAFLDALTQKTQSTARLSAALSEYEIAKAEYHYALGNEIKETIR